MVGEHRRVFGRGHTVFDPWHYVPVLEAACAAALRESVHSADVVLNILGPPARAAAGGDAPDTGGAAAAARSLLPIAPAMTA